MEIYLCGNKILIIPYLNIEIVTFIIIYNEGIFKRLKLP